MKFLAAGEGPEKAFNMLKYATKPQKTLENPLAIYVHAFDKASSKRSPADGAVDAGKRCIQSMCCALSKPQEVAAPLAALYVLRGSPFYKSADLVKVVLNAFVDFIFNNEPVEVMLSCSDTSATYKPTCSVFDYVYRPVSLEGISLMEFTRNWAKEKNLNGQLFMRDHGQHNTHSVHCRTVPAVATILGKRLPDTRNTNIPSESKLIFQRAMMILFKPFRKPDDFQLRGGSFNDMYMNWWSHEAPDSARQFIEYSNDHYTSR